MLLSDSAKLEKSSTWRSTLNVVPHLVLRDSGDCELNQSCQISYPFRVSDCTPEKPPASVAFIANETPNVNVTSSWLLIVWMHASITRPATSAKVPQRCCIMWSGSQAGVSVEVQSSGGNRCAGPRSCVPWRGVFAAFLIRSRSPCPPLLS